MITLLKYDSDGTILEGLKPVIILGSNGSGKTRFGLQLSSWNNAEIIAALRNIALEQNIPMKSLAQAEQELETLKVKRKQKPWSISSEINNLFSKLIAEDSAAAMDFRDKFQSGVTEPDITNLMRLQKSWQSLFPGRQISFRGYVPKVTSEYVAGETGYPAQSMSDGERVALYLAGRVLDAKQGIIIVDEPEVHFHSRLAIQFWDELERLRSDCRFVYITHDLTFAQSRNTDNYLIVRPGKQPELIKIEAGIPSDVAEDILSAASFSIYADRLIFCEGTESSYDQKFLRAWYNGRKDAVIPVGSCREVIKCTSVFRESKVLLGVTAIGLVDRDYWSESFLQSLPDGVTPLPAHEIESLFCDHKLFIAVAEHQGCSVEKANNLYSAFCSEAAYRFREGLLLKQISERFKARCIDQFNKSLNSLCANGSVEDVRTNHCLALSHENWNMIPDVIFDEEKTTINCALIPPYESLLKLLPGKVYLGILTEKLGLEKQAYIDLIINALNHPNKEPLRTLGVNIRSALADALPKE